MYKPSILSYQKMAQEVNKGGKEAVLLAPHNEKLYRVRRYVGLVTEISEDTYTGGRKDINTIKAKFADGVEMEFKAYADDSIIHYSLISVLGIVVEENGVLKLYAKAGCVRAYYTLQEACRIDLRKQYSFDFQELSEIKESIIYPQNPNYICLERDKLYVCVDMPEAIAELERKLLELQTNKSLIDTSMTNEFETNGEICTIV